MSLNVVLKYVVLIMMILVTAILSSMPNFHPEHYLGMGYHWWLDLMIHGGYYFILSVLLYIFYKKEKRPEYLFISILLFSYILELAQREVPGRSFSGLDFLSNTIGVAAAWGVALVWSREKREEPGRHNDTERHGGFLPRRR